MLPTNVAILWVLLLKNMLCNESLLDKNSPRDSIWSVLLQFNFFVRVAGFEQNLTTDSDKTSPTFKTLLTNQVGLQPSHTSKKESEHFCVTSQATSYFHLFCLKILILAQTAKKKQCLKRFTCHCIPSKPEAFPNKFQSSLCEPHLSTKLHSFRTKKKHVQILNWSFYFLFLLWTWVCSISFSQNPRDALGPKTHHKDLNPRLCPQRCTHSACATNSNMMASGDGFSFACSSCSSIMDKVNSNHQ